MPVGGLDSAGGLDRPRLSGAQNLWAGGGLHHMLAAICCLCRQAQSAYHAASDLDLCLLEVCTINPNQTYGHGYAKAWVMMDGYCA